MRLPRAALRLHPLPAPSVRALRPEAQGLPDPEEDGLQEGLHEGGGQQVDLPQREQLPPQAPLLQQAGRQGRPHALRLRGAGGVNSAQQAGAQSAGHGK